MSIDTAKNLPESAPRRDFLVLSAQAMGAIGAAGLAWPFIDSMNPSAEVQALSSVEQDLSAIAEGQEVKIMWRGVPVFIRHRTKKNIEDAATVDMAELRDPETDEARVKKGKEQWLIMLAACTHLGCIPQGGGAGEFGGWFCSCHGSQYDSAGRIRKGPAPKNLVIPPYEFLSDTKVKIG